MQTPLFLFLGDLGGGEIMLIMVVILIFFGANKIPELARGLGKGIREFKDASSEIRSEFENAGRQQPQPPYSATPAQQVPAAPAPTATNYAPDAHSEAATPLASPMNGGTTPTQPERPRFDQMTNE
ncbi:sec-independent protein translocase protein TatA [Hymenobacter daecheongensis DSM 21074]|uniref:Sec-independent protein translocase protein TatA n=1 Tax=Hymenobacter daecheongensis DSM 21074 TaxID=1121955 RepID=A0A1M6LEX2_9BACT|nr:twin-arginine translocase TatA/TatE family subunit [Hymenobacter daecheongensis]SHJ69717.1 sec-independent protein translocase protein TatA [Hymenobacter daecheongensis DSM 21074]